MGEADGGRCYDADKMTAEKQTKKIAVAVVVVVAVAEVAGNTDPEEEVIKNGPAETTLVRT